MDEWRWKLSDKVAVISWGDTHQNHKMGLCKPGFTPEDAAESYKLNAPQKELWYAWEACWEWVNKVVPSGYKKVGISMGDAIENDTKERNPNELVSVTPNDALTLVVETLEPVIRELDYFFVVSGTEAHVGRGAWTESVLARDLGAVKNGNSWVWSVLAAEFGGVKFHIAHHPIGNSSVKRNYPAVASRMAYEVQYSYVDRGEVPPDLGYFAHLHRFADSGTTLKTRVIIHPCFQYKTSYGSRLGLDHSLPDIGMVVTLCENGEYNLDVNRVKPKDKRKIWRIPKTAQLETK